MNIYAIRDLKAEAYMTPFFARTHGEAIRMVQNAVNDPQSGFHKHAADYILFMIGQFEDLTGHIDGEMSPVHVQDLSTLQNINLATSGLGQAILDETSNKGQ